MIIREKLKYWCRPIRNNKAYYRPFICSGDLSKADIFLAGINPGTLIDPEEISSKCVQAEPVHTTLP